MEEELDFTPDYSVDMSIHEIRLILKCIETTLERWAGGDPAEQELLRRARDQYRAMIMDYTFHNM